MANACRAKVDYDIDHLFLFAVFFFQVSGLFADGVAVVQWCCFALFHTGHGAFACHWRRFSHNHSAFCLCCIKFHNFLQVFCFYCFDGLSLLSAGLWLFML